MRDAIGIDPVRRRHRNAARFVGRHLQQHHQPFELRNPFEPDSVAALPVFEHNRIQIEAIAAIIEFSRCNALVDRKFGRLPGPIALQRRFGSITLKQIADPEQRNGLRSHTIAARLIDGGAVDSELGRNL